jgi:hypothetical protein
MKTKVKRKKNTLVITCFVVGLIVYLIGLLLLFSSSISKYSVGKFLFSDVTLTTTLLKQMKIIGSILFIVGFIVFMISVIILYKNDNIEDGDVNLIIEGKADVVTIIVMTYVMIFMLVICLVFNQSIGALLFAICLIIQICLNNFFIKYYNKSYKRKK